MSSPPTSSSPPSYIINNDIEKSLESSTSFVNINSSVKLDVKESLSENSNKSIDLENSLKLNSSTLNASAQPFLFKPKSDINKPIETSFKSMTRSEFVRKGKKKNLISSQPTGNFKPLVNKKENNNSVENFLKPVVSGLEPGSSRTISNFSPAASASSFIKDSSGSKNFKFNSTTKLLNSEPTRCVPMHLYLKPLLTVDPAFSFLTEVESRPQPLYSTWNNSSSKETSDVDIKQLKLAYKNLIAFMLTGNKDKTNVFDTFCKTLKPFEASSFGILWIASNMFLAVSNKKVPFKPKDASITASKRDPDSNTNNVFVHRKSFTHLLIQLVSVKLNSLSDSFSDLIVDIGSKLGNYSGWFSTWIFNLLEECRNPCLSPPFGWDRLNPSQMHRSRLFARRWTFKTIKRFVKAIDRSTWPEYFILDYLKELCYILDTNVENKEEVNEILEMMNLLVKHSPQTTSKIFPHILRSFIYLDLSSDDSSMHETILKIFMTLSNGWKENGFISSAVARYLLSQLHQEFFPMDSHFKQNGISNCSLHVIRWLNNIVKSLSKLHAENLENETIISLLESILPSLLKMLKDIDSLISLNIPTNDSLSNVDAIKSISLWCKLERDIIKNISFSKVKTDFILQESFLVLCKQTKYLQLLKIPESQIDLIGLVTTFEKIMLNQKNDPSSDLLKILAHPLEPFLSLRFQYPHHRTVQKTIYRVVLSLLRKKFPQNIDTVFNQSDPPKNSQLGLLGTMNELFSQIVGCIVSIFSKPTVGSLSDQIPVFKGDASNLFIAECLPSIVSEQLHFLLSCFSSLPLSPFKITVLLQSKLDFVKGSLTPEIYLKWLADVFLGDISLLCFISKSFNLMTDRVYSTIALIFIRLLKAYYYTTKDLSQPFKKNELISFTEAIITFMLPLIVGLLDSILSSRASSSSQTSLYKGGVTEIAQEVLSTIAECPYFETSKSFVFSMISLTRVVYLIDEPTLGINQSKVLFHLINYYSGHSDLNIRRNIGALFSEFVSISYFAKIFAENHFKQFELILERTQEVDLTIRNDYFLSLFIMSPFLNLNLLCPSNFSTTGNFITEVQSSQHSGSFQAQHFQTTLKELNLGSFLIDDLSNCDNSIHKSKNDTWLKLLFRNCFSSNKTWVKVEGLRFELISWLGWEMARYSFLSRLRTPLGGPAQTLESLDKIINSLKESNTPESILLFLKMMYSLEKIISHCRRGHFSSVLPPAPNSATAFFRTNWPICSPWFKVWRPKLIGLASKINSSEFVIHYGSKYLLEIESIAIQSILKAVYYMVLAMVDLGVNDEIAGLQVFVNDRLNPGSELEKSQISVMLDFLMICSNTFCIDKSLDLQRKVSLHNQLFPGDKPLFMTGILVWIQAYTSPPATVDDHFPSFTMNNLTSFDTSLIDTCESIPSTKVILNILSEPLLIYAEQSDESIKQDSRFKIPRAISWFMSNRSHSTLNHRHLYHIFGPISNTLGLLDLKSNISLLSRNDISFIPKYTNYEPPLNLWYKSFNILMKQHNDTEIPINHRQLIYGTLKVIKRTCSSNLYHKCLLEFNERIPCLEGTYYYLKSTLGLSSDLSSIKFSLGIFKNLIIPTHLPLFSGDKDAIFSKTIRKLLGFNLDCLSDPNKYQNMEKALSGPCFLTLVDHLKDESVQPNSYMSQLGEYCTRKLTESSCFKDALALATYYDAWVPHAYQSISTSITFSKSNILYGAIFEIFQKEYPHNNDNILECFLNTIINPVFKYKPPLESLEKNLKWASPHTIKILSKFQSELHNRIIDHIRHALENYCNVMILAGSSNTPNILSSAVAIVGILYQTGIHLDPIFCDNILRKTYHCTSIWHRIGPQLVAGLQHPIPSVANLFEELIYNLVEFDYSAHFVFSLVITLQSHCSDKDTLNLNNHGSVVSRINKILSKIPATIIDYKSLMDWKATISEFQKISILWDEKWASKLTQLKSEFNGLFQKAKSETEWVENNLFPSLTIASNQSLSHQQVLKPIVNEIQKLFDSTLGSSPATLYETSFTNSYGELISKALKLLKDPSNIEKRLEGWTNFMDLLRVLQKKVLHHRNVRLSDISPWLSELSGRLIIPGKTSYTFLQNICDEIQVLPTKTKPKKISMISADGSLHLFLLKGTEDLRIDRCVMQIMKTFNSLLGYKKPGLHASTYHIIPFGGQGGLIEWVEGASPLHAIYRNHQQYEAQAQKIQDQVFKSNSTTTAKQIPIPTEMFWEQARKVLELNGLGSNLSRKNWPSQVNLSVYRNLVDLVPSDIFSRDIQGHCATPLDWIDLSRSLSKSLATMSMIGHGLGLGDRHMGNILLNFKTGEWVHIDFNISFGRGTLLPLPEIVPFRLTRNLQTVGLLGPYSCHFQQSATKVLESLREHRYILRTLLSVFELDSPYDWFASSPFYVQKQQAIDEQTSELNILINRFSLLVPDLQTLSENAQNKIGRLKIRLEASKNYKDLFSYLDSAHSNIKTFFSKLHTVVPLLNQIIKSTTKSQNNVQLISMQSDIINLNSKIKTLNSTISSFSDQKTKVDKIVPLVKQFEETCTLQDVIIASIVKLKSFELKNSCFTNLDLSKDFHSIIKNTLKRLPPLPENNINLLSGYSLIDGFKLPGPTPRQQVDDLIKTAISEEHLASMFEGWTAWI